MPVQTGILTPHGYQPAETMANNLNEAVQHEPAGVYTVARTFKRDHALLLDAHLDRLEESAQLAHIPLQLDRAALRAALRTMIAQSGYENGRFRITVPRQQPDHLYLAMEPLKPVPEHIKQNGVRVRTITEQRDQPTAKSTEWMARRQQATADLPSDTYEAILLGDHGELLEGTGSNFYAILNGVLRTAEKHVLHGITRKALLTCIDNLLPVERQPVTYDDLPQLDEAFLTSSSRGVIPIIQIDDQVIGDGKPGSMTCELQQRYDDWAEAHLEPI